MRPHLVQLHAGWRAELGWLPGAARAGSFLVGPDGEVVRVLGSGRLERVVLGGRPHGGRAEDPA